MKISYVCAYVRYCSYSKRCYLCMLYDGNFCAKNKELNKTWTSFVPENFWISFLITGYVFEDYRYYENTQKSLIDTTMKH